MRGGPLPWQRATDPPPKPIGGGSGDMGSQWGHQVTLASPRAGLKSSCPMPAICIPLHDVASFHELVDHLSVQIFCPLFIGLFKSFFFWSWKISLYFGFTFPIRYESFIQWILQKKFPPLNKCLLEIKKTQRNGKIFSPYGLGEKTLLKWSSYHSSLYQGSSGTLNSIKNHVGPQRPWIAKAI